MIEDIKVVQNNPDGTTTSINADAINGVHKILCPFNVVVDIDFAVLRMIQSEYNNPKFVDQTVMTASTKKVKELLINREDPNPVTICVHNKNIADSIYKEIMLTRYDDLICKYHSDTGIFFLVSVFANLKNVSVTIICQSEKEVDCIKNYNSNICTIVTDDLSTIDVNSYTDIYVHNKNDLYKFNQRFNEKRIALMNYRFNVYIDKKPYPDLQVSKWLYETLSTCCIMDTYSKIKDKNYATLKIALENPKEET